MDASREARSGSWTVWIGLTWGGVATSWLILSVMPGSGRRVQDGLLVAFLGLASLSVAIRIARRLPVQNVVAAFAVLWVMAFVAFKVVAGMEWSALGGRAFNGEVAAPIREAAWLKAWFGAGLVLASREASRWLIRHQVGTATYGFILLGVTMLLTAVGSFNGPLLEEVVPPSRMGAAWLATRGALCGGMFVLTGLMLVTAAPWLVSKRPRPTPPDRASMLGWLMLPLPFLFEDCVEGHWIAAGVGGGLAIPIVAWAWLAGGDTARVMSSRVPAPGRVVV